MLRISLVLGLFFLLSSQHVSACEETAEYSALATEVYNKARVPFDACKESVARYFYWQAIAECEARNNGAYVNGGCPHVVGYEAAAAHYENWKHCEILRVSTEERLSMLTDIAIERNIRKCVE